MAGCGGGRIRLRLRLRSPGQRAPDGHRSPVFLAGPDGQRGPDCRDVVFCRFPHRFRDFCEGFGCFRRGFGPSGPENHKGAHPSASRPLATSLGTTDFLPQSFHATPIGLMLKSGIQVGTVPRCHRPRNQGEQRGRFPL